MEKNLLINFAELLLKWKFWNLQISLKLITQQKINYNLQKLGDFFTFCWSKIFWVDINAWNTF
jgi:hypothetical protein